MTPEVLIALASLVGTIANAIAVIVTAAKTREKVEEVHKATNSIVSKLVATTGKAALAEGVALGRAELQAEQRAQPQP